MRDATPSATIDAAIDGLGARIATRTSAGGFGWTLPDLHGNVAGMLSASGGAVTDAFRYDAYGKLVGSVTSSLPTPWRFQGKLLESTAGNSDLYDFESRSYAPDLGVFTQLDSVAGSAMNPLTLNRYLYADANPETLSDPDGHMARLMDGGSVRSAGAPALSHDDSWSLASSETLARSFALARQVAAQADDRAERVWHRAKALTAAAARSESVLHIPRLASPRPRAKPMGIADDDIPGQLLYGVFENTLGIIGNPIGLVNGMVGTAAFVGRAELAYWTGDRRTIKEQGDAVVSAWVNASPGQKARMLGELLGGVILGKGLGALGAGAEAAEAATSTAIDPLYTNSAYRAGSTFDADALVARTVDADWPAMGSAGHSGRVAACVSAYCDYAGISGAEKEAEVTLAKIHDIGKSGVVSGAMRPVERIAEADMTDMQYVFYSKAKPMHETYGAQLAADAGAPADIVNDVATHGGLTPQTSGRAIRLQIFDALDTKFRFYTWGGPADSWIAAALKFRPMPWQVEEWSRIKPWIMDGGLDGIPVPVGGY